MGMSDGRGRHEERVGERSSRADGIGMEGAPGAEDRRGEHGAAEERGVREVGSSSPPSRSTLHRAWISVQWPSVASVASVNIAT